MLNKMLSLSATMHNTQVDLAGVQYIFHIMRVTENCRQMWGHKDEELLAIAAGHDLLEDTVCSKATIFFEFGERVHDAIVALSKYEGQTYEEYQAAVLSNEDAMRVKLADLKDNMDSSRYGHNYDVDKITKRFRKYSAFDALIRERLEELDAQTLMGIY